MSDLFNAGGVGETSILETVVDRDADQVLPFQAGGRWKTAEAYAMRRIVPLKDACGKVIGYRPTIQQGRGLTRQTHSGVFRITREVNLSMAMAMAQRWRDNKELELGISAGQISSKSASRFVPGISLVVTNKTPYRACWKWTSTDYSSVIRYMGKKVGFEESYRSLVQRICEVIGCEIPADLTIPVPNPVQYASLLAMGVCQLPDRRNSDRNWTAP
ncbi:hypothetical protein [Pseudomonas syringae]|uniref:hypothetical protein n=1 Tax=Pseudomonas syringae TaxID=317 RepID=UPI001F46CAD9|nr:hypothetical protein [Pseudomonas syringae]MCF5371346.1 hypothetical protein [Pseudomonas syringae]MCF5382472.1 hypothetical protein [Pseudomonas syringae]MCF5419359.1 hypothetical protein [Pseudomonas syringae]MCF5455039.1 hypothetical protein [Pseudomonas syringae]MCF5460481.1 hypothetical protein [Pseudomonas syringae]